MFSKQTFTLFFATMTLVACGSNPAKVGVRSTFATASVDSLAVGTLHATNPFSLTEEEFTVVKTKYAEAVDRAVNANGFKLVTTDQLNAQIAASKTPTLYNDGIETSKSISNLFEQQDPTEVPLETLTVVAIGELVEANALLVGEVVYHTRGSCDEDPSEFNPHVHRLGPKEPGPCVVSHFQSKLIDFKTGKTMWTNRVLVENRTGDSDAIEQSTIEAAVQQTLFGEAGILAFRAQ